MSYSSPPRPPSLVPPSYSRTSAPPSVRPVPPPPGGLGDAATTATATAATATASTPTASRGDSTPAEGGAAGGPPNGPPGGPPPSGDPGEAHALVRVDEHAVRTRPTQGVTVFRAATPAVWPEGVWDNTATAPAPAVDPGAIVDVGRLGVLLGYPWRAVRRRPKLAAAVFAIVLAAAAITAWASPRAYDVETTIMAQKNFVMPALGNPRRAVPAESDSPTRMAAEAVLNRDNLLSIIDELGLEAAWSDIRSPVGRAKDLARRLIKGPMTPAERRDKLVDYLYEKLWVMSNEGTVHIGTHFPKPWLAYRLVQVAERNFIESRRQQELALIRESIGILEKHVTTAHDNIESSLADVRRYTPPARRGPALGPAGLAAVPGASAAAQRNPAVAALERDLAVRRGALDQAETARTQRLAALEARLVDLQRTLGPAHPDVVSTQQALAELRPEPAELVALRAAARDAEVRVASAGGSTRVVGRTTDPSTALATATLARLEMPGAVADTLEAPELTYARSRLKIAVAAYEDLLDRLEGARIELETARAAFRYRYVVLSPPQYPQRLAKPNVPLLLVGGAIAAAALAAFTVLALEVGSGRVMEPWQVSRIVGVPVLGEVPPP